MKNLLLILLIALFVSCTDMKDPQPKGDCWLVVQVFGWTNLPSGTTVTEITIEKDGIRRVIRKKGYKIGDYYCY